jgi:cytochrome c2
MRPGCILVAFPILILAGATAGQADDHGEEVFKRNCAMCHSVEPGKNRVGPSLAGVVGRRAGSVPGFSYSSANSHSGIVWTKEALDQYLTDPQKMVPGTLMIFPGLKNPDDRRAVIDYLAENSGT